MLLLSRSSNHIPDEIWELLDMLLAFSPQSHSFTISVQWRTLLLKEQWLQRLQVKEMKRNLIYTYVN